MPDDLRVLGFDTSAAHCAAAVICGDRVLAERVEPMSRGQGERLFPLMEEMLAEAGLSWSDLDAIGVGIGPGNFTGIRLSVAAARGLSLSLGIPAVGVSATESAACGAPRPCRAVVPLRGDEVAWQDFGLPDPASAKGKAMAGNGGEVAETLAVGAQASRHADSGGDGHPESAPAPPSGALAQLPRAIGAVAYRSGGETRRAGALSGSMSRDAADQASIAGADPASGDDVADRRHPALDAALDTRFAACAGPSGIITAHVGGPFIAASPDGDRPVGSQPFAARPASDPRQDLRPAVAKTGTARPGRGDKDVPPPAVEPFASGTEPQASGVAARPADLSGEAPEPGSAVADEPTPVPYGRNALQPSPEAPNLHGAGVRPASGPTSSHGDRLPPGPPVCLPLYPVAVAIARIARDRASGATTTSGMPRPAPLYLRPADAAPAKDPPPVILP